MNPGEFIEKDKDFGDGDFFCVEGIVAENEDPENLCRVQLVIPIIDENVIHEVWARRGNAYVGATGFGDYFVPEIGAECLVWGRMGDTNNLFYMPLYNETHRASAEFPDKENAGVHVPGNLKLIAELLARLKARDIEIIAAELAKMVGRNVQINAEQAAELKGNSVTVEAAQAALLKGGSVSIEGATVTLKNGNISIQGGNVTVTGSSIKLHGRTVNPTGPSI